MFLRLLVVAAITACSSAASSRTYLGPRGGNGGGEFYAICNSGEILIGLGVQVNNALRVVAPLCGIAVTPSELDESSVYTFPVAHGTVQAPGRLMRCPANAPAVRAMQIDAHPELNLVDLVELHCGPASDLAPPVGVGTKPDVSWRGGDDGGLFSPFRGTDFFACPQGQVPVGVFGRSGASVDALGLVCDVPVLRKADWSKGASPDAKKGMLGGQRLGTGSSQWREPGTSAAEGLGPLTSSGTTPTPTPVVITLTVSATQTTGNDNYDVKLAWSGATATNVDIYRSGTLLTSTANDGEFVDSLRNGTYTFRVCNAGSTSECSSDKAVTF